MSHRLRKTVLCGFLAFCATALCRSQCPLSAAGGGGGAGAPTLTISAAAAGDTSVTGHVLDATGKAPDGNVRVCINGALSGIADPIFVQHDGYYIAKPTAALVLGDTITAQFVSAAGGPSSQIEYLVVGPAAPLVAPSITSKFEAGTTVLQGTAQPNTPGYPGNTPTQISICVWTSEPAAGAMDCTKGSPAPAAVIDPTNIKTSALYVAPTNGSFTAHLSKALTAGEYVSLVEVATDSNTHPQTAFSTAASVKAGALPIAPIITTKFVAGTTVLQGIAQPVSSEFPGPAKIYVCVWTSQPAADAMNCTSGSTKPQELVVPAGQTDKTYITPSRDGTFTAQLTTALTAGEYVSAVEVSTDALTVPQTVTAAAATGVPTATQCNKNYDTEPFSDCDMSLSLIGGVEQSAQSSSPSETTPFLRVFTRAAPWHDHPYYFWGYVRLLGAPTTSSTQGVVSVASNPSGSLTTQTFSTIGTSIDYMLGGERQFAKKEFRKFDYSGSFILGYGATTPLQANTLTLAYVAPAFGTVECSALFARFAPLFTADKITQGTTMNTTQSTPPPATPVASCLVNENSATVSGSTTTYAPINTIGFSNQDRSSILTKYGFGIRTIDRFLGSGNIACGNADTAIQVGPCERGIIDLIFGQDASITRGQLRNWIFKIDAVHPLPVGGSNILYIFGSASARLVHNTNLPPLILQSANVSSLTGTSGVPNPSIVVLPLTVPNRDFYRFGVGINISQIFTTLFSSGTKTATNQSTTNPSSPSGSTPTEAGSIPKK